VEYHTYVLLNSFYSSLSVQGNLLRTRIR